MKSACVLPLLLCFLLIASARAEDRPNILWLTSEDNSVDWIGCYGNPYAETPNIDKLATEGFQYTHCYSNAPVCAPSRSTWITGMHSISTGTHQMRSRYPIPHNRIQYYPDHLKKAGYYVGNSRKTDYNIGGRPDGDAWDTAKVNWKTLKQNQPFMMVINSTKSHESKAFGSVEKTEHSPDEVKLAKYHPDIPAIRKNYAHYHDQIKKMDADIGAALAGLERAGLVEDTIVVYNSDHGGVLARSKRFLYNSGTHCPLVVRIPEKFKHLRPGEPGGKVDQLVSFIDMPKTWLALAGAKIPDYMQGKVFLGPGKEPRDLHVSFRGRMDARCDNVRSARSADGRFLYIRNYMPYAPWGQRLTYLWQMEATRAWEAHHQAGRTDAVTGRFFQTKPMEEFYDTAADPDNITNLIDKPEHAAEIKRLSGRLDQWQRDTYDCGLLPETELARRAEKASKTIFDVVRDPELYDLPSLQAAAALALQQDPAKLPALYANLKSADAGVRYWGVTGLFLLPEKVELDLAKMKMCLEDDSHHARAMAAWIFFNRGEKELARKVWSDLLSESSYASLKVLNIIDWIGDGTAGFEKAIAACEFNHFGYVKRMKENLADQEKLRGKKAK